MGKDKQVGLFESAAAHTLADMFDGPVVYVDIETSGSSFAYSSIIEVAAIRVERGEVTDTFTSLVNPGKPLPVWITNLTGISQNDVAAAPYFADIAAELHSVLDGALFVAHNVHFDFSYIKRQLETCGVRYRPRLLCTVRLSRALYPQHQGHSLEKIIQRHGIAVSHRHRAYDDAAAMKVFAEKAFLEHGSESFAAAVAKQLKKQSVPANLDDAVIDSLPKAPGVYVFQDENGQPAYIGKSVAIRNRVMSHFNQAKHDSHELKLAQKTHGIKVFETKSELEALLLESKMIKELQPLLNKKLRRRKSLYVLQGAYDAAGYLTLSIELATLDSDSLGKVYGVYDSKMKAKAALERVMREHELCPKLLGLEKASHGCFWSQLRKCRGACKGSEAVESYNSRAEKALSRGKLEAWPYKTPIMIKLHAGESLVVEDWTVAGYVDTEDGEPRRFRAVPKAFELDTYKILREYLTRKRTASVIRPIQPATLRRLSQQLA